MSSMRDYIDAISEPEILDEGIIDSVKQWIQKLNSPVKTRGQELVTQLESQLVARYSGQVAAQIKQSNKSWMWGRLTYQTIYTFATQVAGLNDAELDRALKNPIVTNNLRQLYRMSTDTTQQMQLPLSSGIIKNNNSYISTVIDPQSKQYLSKAIAVAILDGVAYIEQEKKDNAQRQATRAQEPQIATQGNQTNNVQQQPSSGGEISIDELKAAIMAIKQGLAKVKGAVA